MYGVYYSMYWLKTTKKKICTLFLRLTHFAQDFNDIYLFFVIFCENKKVIDIKKRGQFVI